MSNPFDKFDHLPQDYIISTPATALDNIARFLLIDDVNLALGAAALWIFWFYWHYGLKAIPRHYEYSSASSSVFSRIALFLEKTSPWNTPFTITVFVFLPAIVFYANNIFGAFSTLLISFLSSAFFSLFFYFLNQRLLLALSFIGFFRHNSVLDMDHQVGFNRIDFQCTKLVYFN